ncbi:MAG: hypothetical protein KJ915_02115 [Candidatus Omnitrophica bacterium]|nr:hypothetical protein [Candidatus Omnitrophota bacterium]
MKSKLLFFLLVLLFLEIPCFSSTDEYPHNIGPININDCMLQMLPHQLSSVYIGPDDRIWYQLSSMGGMREDPNISLKVIMNQFDKKEPQLYDCEPALFESNGRIWFLRDNGRIMSGYDGKEWIHHTIHNEYFRSKSNYQIGKHLFFIGASGVHIFDGEKWSFKKIVERTYHNNVYLYLEPDKLGVLAVGITEINDGGNIARGNVLDLWRWRDEKWEHIIDYNTQIEQITPSNGGVWATKDYDSMDFIPYKNASKKVDFIGLFESLKSAETDEVRRDIAQQILNLGENVRHDIKKALNETYDSNALEQLMWVLEELSGKDSFTQSGKDSFTQFGDLNIEKIRRLHIDNQTGISFFKVENVLKKGEKVEDGLLVLNYQDKPIFHSGKEFIESGAWTKTYLCPDGKSIWIGGYNGSKPRRLDFVKGVFIDEIPEMNTTSVIGMKKEGMVFFTKEGKPGIYQSEKADNRKILKEETFDLKSERFCVDSNGNIWAILEERGLSFYDGKTWHLAPEVLRNRKIKYMLPGKEGRILCCMDTLYFYITPDKVFQSENLKDLIFKNRDDARKHFTSMPSEKECYYSFVNGIVADSNGNIWLLDARKLSVLISDKWFNAKSTLMEAGARTGEPWYINTVGNGEKVYITDFGLADDSGSSFFGNIQDGKMVFEKAPHTSEEVYMKSSIKDVSGALWIPATNNMSMGVCDSVGQAATCVNEKGIIGSLKDSGWPILCDGAQNIWLNDIRGKKSNTFFVCRNNEIVDEIVIPFSSSSSSYLFSDAPGSVYLWSSFGMDHLKADRKSDFKDYEIADIYYLEKYQGEISKSFYSRKGYLAFISTTSGSKKENILHLISLPEKALEEDKAFKEEK